ncbi:MAG: hypothetical protein JW768_11630 [Chitinispirillaceae bacterium]|nr:hypothetical protein [Chitinispirillaceae bacterium]
MNSVRVSLYSATVFVAIFAATLFGQNTLMLNIDRATYKIHRAIYGALMEDLGRCVYQGLYVGTGSSIPNTNGMRNDILEAFKEGGITCLEWPGGCAANSYHWRDGIGPKSSRPGGDRVNGMGTDEYMQMNELVGAEPYITNNMVNGTAAESAAWLTYVDSVFPGKLIWWKYGNEMWGGCGAGWTVTQYQSVLRQFLSAEPSNFNGPIYRIAQGSRDYETPANYWSDSMMNHSLSLYDGLSWHFYAVTNWSAKGSSTSFTESGYYAQLQKAHDLEGLIRAHEAVMNKYDPNYTKDMIVDEWGAWYDAIGGMGALYQQNTVRDAVIAGMSLNMFNNHCRRIKMALVAQAINVIQALILTQPSPGAAMVRTPTFYVFKQYKAHHNATMVPAILTCPNNQNIPLLSASASIDSLQRLHISLVNTHASSNQTVRVTLNNPPRPFTACTGTVVNGPSITSLNDFNTAERVNVQPFASSNFSLSGSTLNVTLPAHSVVTLELSGQGTWIPETRKRAKDHGITIAAVPGNRIVVGSAGSVFSPVSVIVTGIDGKKIEGTITSPTNCTRQLVWQPAGHDKACRVCIVNVRAGDFIESQKVMLAR